jgi:hypothetical protein
LLLRLLLLLLLLLLGAPWVLLLPGAQHGWREQQHLQLLLLG